MRKIENGYIQDPTDDDVVITKTRKSYTCKFKISADLLYKTGDC